MKLSTKQSWRKVCDRSLCIVHSTVDINDGKQRCIVSPLPLVCFSVCLHIFTRSACCWHDELEGVEMPFLCIRCCFLCAKVPLHYHCTLFSEADRWPETGYVKKLQRRDGCFYYYNRKRECPDKEIHKTKIYAY